MNYKEIFNNILAFECSEENLEGYVDVVHIMPDRGLAGETIVYVPSREIFMVYITSPFELEDSVQYYAKDGTLVHAKSVNPVNEAILNLSKVDKSEFMNEEYEGF